MTIPNDDSTPDQPASEQPVTPPAPPVPPAPPAPPAPPVPPAAYPAAPPAPGAFPAYSAAPAPVAAPSAPPTPVNAAFWLYIAAAVLSVVSGIVTIASLGSSRQTLIDQLQRTNNLKTNGLTLQQIADTAIAGITVLSIITMIFWVVVFVLFAVFMRRGANWARIVLTVLTVVSLLNIPDGYFVGAVQVIAAIFATVLIWLKPASAYFAAVKASKVLRA